MLQKNKKTTYINWTKEEYFLNRKCLKRTQNVNKFINILYQFFNHKYMKSNCQIYKNMCISILISIYLYIHQIYFVYIRLYFYQFLEQI